MRLYSSQCTVPGPVIVFDTARSWESLMSEWPELASVKKLVVYHGDTAQEAAGHPSHAEICKRDPKDLKFKHSVTGNVWPNR